MNRARLEAALGSKIQPALATALVDHFLKIRQDAATKTLERAVAGILSRRLCSPSSG